MYVFIFLFRVSCLYKLVLYKSSSIFINHISFSYLDVVLALNLDASQELFFSRVRDDDPGSEEDEWRLVLFCNLLLFLLFAASAKRFYLSFSFSITPARHFPRAPFVSPTHTAHFLSKTAFSRCTASTFPSEERAARSNLHAPRPPALFLRSGREKNQHLERRETGAF